MHELRASRPGPGPLIIRQRFLKADSCADSNRHAPLALLELRKGVLFREPAEKPEPPASQIAQTKHCLDDR